MLGNSSCIGISFVHWRFVAGDLHPLGRCAFALGAERCLPSACRCCKEAPRPEMDRRGGAGRSGPPVNSFPRTTGSPSSLPVAHVPLRRRSVANTALLVLRAGSGPPLHGPRPAGADACKAVTALAGRSGPAGPCLRLRAEGRKWLRAGIVEDGSWSEYDAGTSQGATASPLLANVYLHLVFDLWAER